MRQILNQVCFFAIVWISYFATFTDTPYFNEIQTIG